MLRRLSLGTSLLLLLASAVHAQQRPLEFQVTFDKAVSPTPFTSRVFVVLSSANRASDKPPLMLNWFDPEPVFAIDVKDWNPGETRVIGADSIHHKFALDKLPKGKYKAQAILDRDQGGISFAASESNGYSKLVPLDYDPANAGPVKLHIDQVYHEPEFKETDRVKLVDIESKLLSEFHKKPIHLRAGVVLPKSYAEKAGQHYPVLYEIPGFSGNHFSARNSLGRTEVAGVEMIYVVLDPSCRTG